MTKKLLVRNLPFATTAADLHKIFEPFGKVTVELQTHPGSSRSKGFAYLTFETEEAATKALEEKHGVLLEGRVMKVLKYEPRQAKQKARNRRHNRPTKTRGDEICFGYPINQQIYVGGIGNLDEANVHAIFVPFGDIAQVDIMRHKRDGHPKGYGFVIFHTPMAAKAALEMDGEEIAGCKLKVSLAKMKKKYPRSAQYPDPMGPDSVPGFNTWPNYSMGTMPIHNPYQTPVAADFPQQEFDQNIAPMPGGTSLPYIGPPITPPPPSEHSDHMQQVPFFFMNQGMQPQASSGYLTPDLPGLIAGYGNLSLDNNQNYWGAPHSEEQRTLNPDADRVARVPRREN